MRITGAATVDGATTANSTITNSTITTYSADSSMPISTLIQPLAVDGVPSDVVTPEAAFESFVPGDRGDLIPNG